MRTDVGVHDMFVQGYFGSAEIELPVPRELLRDDESLATWPSTGALSYVFGEPTAAHEQSKSAHSLIAALDEYGIERAQIPISPNSPVEFFDALDAYPDRLLATLRVNPHHGQDAVRQIEQMCDRFPLQLRSLSITPATLSPQIAPNSKEFYPLYSKCIERDIAVMLNVGVPVPRVPSATQHPMLLEEVVWFFPELRVVMKHGGEPWTDECVKLLRKWPNLYFITTAFTPHRYPQVIVDYLRGRGAEKIIYAGYFPLVGFDKSFRELAAIELDDGVARRLLRENARDVFRLST